MLDKLYSVFNIIITMFETEAKPALVFRSIVIGFLFMLLLMIVLLKVI